MFMMCWFYCIPFMKGLFFAFGPLLIAFSLFVLKRGVRQSRPGLRQLAFMMMLLAVMKMFTVDIYLMRDVLPCGADRFLSICNTADFKKLQGAGLVLLAVCGFLLVNLYRNFANNKPQRIVTPDQARLSFWANLSISFVMLLIFWLAAPWAGFLTVGYVPDLFLQVPWQYLAFLNIVILLQGFWKLEDCGALHHSIDKNRRGYQSRVWTAKDTLWVSVVLFLIALALSYASNDVLSSAMPEKGSHSIPFEKVNMKDVPGFRYPGK